MIDYQTTLLGRTEVAEGTMAFQFEKVLDSWRVGQDYVSSEFQHFRVAFRKHLFVGSRDAGPVT